MSATDIAEPETEKTEPFQPEQDTSGTIIPFQFSAASSLTPARQESLDTWHRKFLRVASGTLGDLLRLELELRLVSVQIVTYAQVMQERKGENQCILFRMNPQPGIWLMDLPLNVSLMLVDRMMGGPGTPPSGEARNLTELDQAIFQQFAETFLTEYARSWRPHAELQPDVLRQVRNLNYQLIHQPDDLVLRIGIEIGFKGSKSVMWVLAPITSVEELLMKSLASDDRVKQEDSAGVNDKSSPMGSVPVPVSIRWQGFQLTLRDVEAMTPGDVLMLDNKKCESAAVWLGDKAKFVGRVMRDSQKTTVTITGNWE